MTEIASPSSFPSSTGPLSHGQREHRPRAGAEPEVPFGALVSEAAKVRPRPAQAPETDSRPPERREARANDTPQPAAPPSRATDGHPPPQKPGHASHGHGQEVASNADRAEKTAEPPHKGSAAVEAEFAKSAAAEAEVTVCAPFGEEPVLVNCLDLLAPDDAANADLLTPTLPEALVDPTLPLPAFDATGAPALLPPDPKIIAGPVLPPLGLPVTSGPVLPSGPVIEAADNSALPPASAIQAIGGPALPPVPVIEPTGGPALPAASTIQATGTPAQPVPSAIPASGTPALAVPSAILATGTPALPLTSVLQADGGPALPPPSAVQIQKTNGLGVPSPSVVEVPGGPAPAEPSVAEAIGSPALPVPSAAGVNGGSAPPLSVPGNVQPVAELDTTSDTGTEPGSARPATLVAEGPAMGIIAALSPGEKPARAQVSPEPAIPAIPVEMAQTPVTLKGSADLVALMQAKGGEAATKTAMIGSPIPEKGVVAGEIAKVQFADWINEFAFQQGAMHRSGDLVGSLDRALAALPTPHAGQDALRPTPLQMLPIEIGMQAMRGVKTFQIRLDPAELGRVEVKLEIREDGEVKANLVVDRVETLAMLKRDANTLQQAFEQAGLRQSADGLNFQLRGEQQGRDGQRQQPAQSQPGLLAEADETGLARPNDIVMRRMMIPNSSLDLVI